MIKAVKEIARDAGKAVLEVYGTEFDVETKEDSSPLTEADRRSNEVIETALKKQFPEIPIISEETKALDFEDRKDWGEFWLVDPLDGTKEFVKRNGEFTVNIALIRNGVPVLGVVFQPVGDHLFWASEGEGAWKSTDGGAAIRLQGGEHYRSKDSITVVASRSHLTDQVRDFVSELEEEGKSVTFLSAGSSLKLCLVAEGAADVYPRLGPTMEWDTGAAHAIARAAGREVLQFETREPLRYNKEDLLNPFFVVE